MFGEAIADNDANQMIVQYSRTTGEKNSKVVKKKQCNHIKRDRAKSSYCGVTLKKLGDLFNIMWLIFQFLFNKLLLLFYFCEA